MLHKLDDIPVTVTLDQALKRLAVTEPDDVALISGLFGEAKRIARPKALYREAFVEEVSGRRVRIDGFDFESDVLAMNLKNVHRVFAYVCTCGTEVDDWPRGEKDYVVSLWLDMIKEMFLREADAFLRAHLKSVFGPGRLSSNNPGSGNAENWPISQQAALFALIGDVKGEIGVTLKDTFLMVPIKSTSGLIFPSEADFVNCALCFRENCPGRRAEFDKKLYDKAFCKIS
ncbi:MAG: vitamin B12 dependent methionine synthase [Firmicutes bacterium]|nr:vitamin B12 dependent methionine synthase [Bacillota bacterium]